MKEKKTAEGAKDAISKELKNEFDADRLEIAVKERSGDIEFPYIVVVRMQIRDLPWMVLTLIDRVCYYLSEEFGEVIVPYGISTFITKDGRFIFEVGIR